MSLGPGGQTLRNRLWWNSGSYWYDMKDATSWLALPQSSGNMSGDNYYGYNEHYTHTWMGELEASGPVVNDDDYDVYLWCG